jgi:hypothetical protein
MLCDEPHSTKTVTELLKKRDRSMIPAGYMYKLVNASPGGVTAKNVVDIFSVGACGAGTSPFFTEYIPYWKHNGYWFFNSPDTLQEIARQDDIDLSRMTLLYYETYGYEFDQSGDSKVAGWVPFECERSFVTDVLIPQEKALAGYDVVEYVCRNSPECSLLSCCDLAAKFTVNSHCLFDTFEEAKKALESGEFRTCEPGPY